MSEEEEKMTEKDYTTSSLAYLGDCVFELCVREHLVRSGISRSATLNRTALSFVTAPKQAAFMEKIRSALNEEEQLVCRRGRNMPHANIPKSASAAEYSRATELEVLFGYLYLTEKKDRINELFALICEE